MASQTGNEVLPQIVSKLSSDYYEPLKQLCDSINGHVDQFENKGLFIEQINYTAFLTAETERFIEQRAALFVPYLLELSEKSSTGHDCANCSGRCDMQHTLKLLEFSNSLKKMQSTSTYIQREFAAIDRHKGNNDDTLSWLRSQVALLGNLLDDLLQKEDMLIPDIQYAQKRINAHS